MFMKSLSIFHYLDTTDSTNNYAMRLVHEGLAKHGMAWFANDQTAGKGQRGRKWISKPGENIMMSIAFNPPKAFLAAPFLFNALITVTCRHFFDKLIPEDLKIKWPNDLWVGDRKAGGILIENKYQGSDWNWSVVGIGFNVNQLEFSSQLKNPVSLQQLTGKSYDAVQLARELHLMLLAAIEGFEISHRMQLMKTYNTHLFRRDEMARFRKKNMLFDSKVMEVNDQGQLLTEDAIPRNFDFGEIEWVL